MVVGATVAVGTLTTEAVLAGVTVGNPVKATGVRVVEGREFVTRPAYDAGIEEYLRPLFHQLYTMSFDNYPVEAERVHGMRLAECRSRR